MTSFPASKLHRRAAREHAAFTSALKDGSFKPAPLPSCFAELVEPWTEYDAVAEACAKQHLSSDEALRKEVEMTEACWALIEADPDAFNQRVRDTAYGLAMSALNLPEDA